MRGKIGNLFCILETVQCLFGVLSCGFLDQDLFCSRRVHTFQKARGSIVSNRIGHRGIGMKSGRIVRQVNSHRLTRWICDMTS